MAAVIFSGNSVKALKNSLILGTQATIWSGNADPSSSATTGTIGDFYIDTGTPNVYQKITTSGTDTNWRLIPTSAGAGSPGDISETSFSAANNQSAAANVTGLAFANATVRSFEALVSVYVNATTSLYEVFKLQGIQKGASWNMSATSTGDSSGFVFSITSAGQVQYTDSNYTGFSAATVKFRAQTLSV